MTENPLKDNRPLRQALSGSQNVLESDGRYPVSDALCSISRLAESTQRQFPMTLEAGTIDLFREPSIGHDEPLRCTFGAHLRCTMSRGNKKGQPFLLVDLGECNGGWGGSRTPDTGIFRVLICGNGQNRAEITMPFTCCFNNSSASVV